MPVAMSAQHVERGHPGVLADDAHQSHRAVDEGRRSANAAGYPGPELDDEAAQVASAARPLLRHATVLTRVPCTQRAARRDERRRAAARQGEPMLPMLGNLVWSERTLCVQVPPHLEEPAA